MTDNSIDSYLVNDVLLALQGIESYTFKYHRDGGETVVIDDDFKWFWDQQNEKDSNEKIGEFTLMLGNDSSEVEKRTWKRNVSLNDALKGYCNIASDARFLLEFAKYAAINHHKFGRVLSAFVSVLNSFCNHFQATILSIPSLITSSSGNDTTLLQIQLITRPLCWQLKSLVVLVKSSGSEQFDSFPQGGKLLSHIYSFLLSSNSYTREILLKLFIKCLKAYSESILTYVNTGDIDNGSDFFLEEDNNIPKNMRLFTKEMNDFNSSPELCLQSYISWFKNVTIKDPPNFLDDDDVSSILYCGLLTRIMNIIPPFHLTLHQQKPLKDNFSLSMKMTKEQEKEVKVLMTSQALKRSKQQITKSGIDESLRVRQIEREREQLRDKEEQERIDKVLQDKKELTEKAKQEMIVEHEEFIDSEEKKQRRIEWLKARRDVHNRHQNEKEVNEESKTEEKKFEEKEEKKFEEKEEKKFEEKEEKKMNDVNVKSNNYNNSWSIDTIKDKSHLKNVPAPENNNKQVLNIDELSSNKNDATNYSPNSDMSIEVTIAPPDAVKLIDPDDNAPIHSLLDIMMMSMIKERYMLLSYILCHYTRDVLLLKRHLIAIQDYILLLRSDFRLELMNEISNIRGSEPSPVVLHNAMENAIVLSSAHDDVSSKYVSVSLTDDTSIRLIPGRLDLFDRLKITYRYPALLSLIITPEHRDNYSSLSHALILISRTRDLSVQLSKKIFEVKSMINDGNGCSWSKYGWNSEWISKLCIFRLEALHFLDVYSHYIQVRVLSSCWKRMVDNIERADSIHDLQMAHSEYVGMMMTGCFLSAKSSGIQNITLSMLGCIALFSNICEDSLTSLLNDHNGEEEAKALSRYDTLNEGIIKYRKLAMFLFKVLKKAKQKGTSDALEELLELFDFDYFYEKNDETSNDVEYNN